MYVKEIGCSVIDWIYLAQDRDKLWAFVNMVMNALVLYAVSSVKCACVYVCVWQTYVYNLKIRSSTNRHCGTT